MPFTRGRALRDASLPWDVRQLHDDPDPATTRTAVLDDLEHGVSSVWVHVGEDGVAVDDLAEALAEVRLDLAPVAVSSTTDQAPAARALLDVAADHPPARCRSDWTPSARPPAWAERPTSTRSPTSCARAPHGRGRTP